jgi:DNA-binding response OmpR family regulator
MRLLVVEDDDPLAAALTEGLAGEGFSVDRTDTAEDAFRLVGVNPYDLIVLDVGLPAADGTTLLRALRERNDPVPVLLLTARGTLADRIAGLNLGADDYLRKPFAFAELVARIRAVLRRGPAAVPVLLHVSDLELDPVRFAVHYRGRPIPLTSKEFALLEYLMRHVGELVTRTMLLEHCWDEHYDGLSNVVDVHIARVRKKLHAVGAPSMLHTVRRAGFILKEHPG